MVKLCVIPQTALEELAAIADVPVSLPPLPADVEAALELARVALISNGYMSPRLVEDVVMQLARALLKCCGRGE